MALFSDLFRLDVAEQLLRVPAVDALRLVLTGNGPEMLPNQAELFS